MHGALDAITIATQKYIEKNRKFLVRELNELLTKPFWEEPDPFDEWAKRVRAEREILDGINGS